MEEPTTLFKNLRILELALNVTRPAFVKRVLPFFDIEYMGQEDTVTILMGAVKVYIETEVCAFCVMLSFCPDVYRNEGEKEETKEKIKQLVGDDLQNYLNSCSYETFWDNIDFDNEDWKEEEGF